MKRSNEFNTCLHFDLSDSLHRKAVELLENYDKKKYHASVHAITLRKSLFDTEKRAPEGSVYKNSQSAVS